MKRNMGTFDRLARLVIGPMLIVLGIVLGAGTIPGLVAFVLAGVALVTAVVGVCPGYVPFGLSTRGGVSTHGRVRFGGRSRVAAQH
jgi:amino acid transporter